MIAKDLLAPVLRDHVSRSRQRGNLVHWGPQKDPLRPTPQPLKRCIVIKDVWRIAEERAIPEIGRTAIENTDLAAQIEAQG